MERDYQVLRFVVSQYTKSMGKFSKVIVVGASSGIGRSVAELLLKEGASVALLGRRTKKLEEISSGSGKAFSYEHDVHNYDEISTLFQRITTDLGGLDLIVYASGVMPDVDEHEYNFAKDREMIEVNLLGAIAWIGQAAARFEQVKSGTIVGISSIAGERGRRGNPAYCTSKAALTTFLESMRNRLTRYGVHVLTVKPGFIDTEMTRGKSGLFWLISSDEAAKEILEAAEGNAQEIFVPGRWRWVAMAVRNVPSVLFRKLGI